jgi:TIR domain
LQATGIVFNNENILNGRIILDQKWAIDIFYILFKPGSTIEKILKTRRGKIQLSDIYDELKDYSSYEKDLLLSYFKISYSIFEIGYNYYNSPSERTFICPKYLPYTNDLKISDKAQCNFSIRIPGFSMLDFLDLICVLSRQLNIYYYSLFQEKFEFDYLHNCNGQICFIAKSSEIFISLLENDSSSIEIELSRAVDILGFTIEDSNSKVKKKIPKPSLNIFVCYSHQYKKSSTLFISKLDSFVKSHSKLKINLWSDHQIFIGEDWHQKIQEAINKSNLCILLLCQDFFLSPYIQDHELKEFLEKNEKSGYPIIPVPLAPYIFKDHEAILERHHFIPDENEFEGLSAKIKYFNQLVYNKTEFNAEAIHSFNVDTYFRQFGTKLYDIFEGLLPKLHS